MKMKISESLCDTVEDLKRVGESCGEYEDTESRKLHSESYDQKRTPRILGEIQTMVDNYPCASVRSITNDMELSEVFFQAGSA